MKKENRLTWILLALVLLVFFLTAPAALRRALQQGQFYVFTSLFFSDIAPRLTGFGRLRFILQPLVALLLGARDGRADARAGRTPYLWALASGQEERGALLRSAARSIANIVLVAVLLDTIAQWLIFGVVSPGAALIIGPVLISAPYALSRSLVNRALRSANPG